MDSNTTVRRVHHVVFLSPGSFTSECSSREIPSWDPALACEMSTQIVERYGARPYAFYFTTSIAAPDVPDGLGGSLRVEPREIERSGLYHLGGQILTVEDAERERGERSVLASNMRNNWPLVVETRNSFRHNAPFAVRDVIVNVKGEIVERGDTPERIAYRARFIAPIG